MRKDQQVEILGKAVPGRGDNGDMAYTEHILGAFKEQRESQCDLSLVLVGGFGFPRNCPQAFLYLSLDPR